MDSSFSAPTAMEFKALYDETGWADWTLDRFERALVGPGSSAPCVTTPVV